MNAASNERFVPLCITQQGTFLEYASLYGRDFQKGTVHKLSLLIGLAGWLKVSLSQKEILVSSILPKNNLIMLIFALAYWGRNFLFVFWRIERTKKPCRN